MITFQNTNIFFFYNKRLCNFADKKGPLPTVNNFVMYEALFTQMPISNQAAFYWITWQIILTQFKLLFQNLC